MEPNPPPPDHGNSPEGPADEAADVGKLASADALERRQGRQRTLLVIGVALLVLCVVGAAIGYVAYDRVTRIDRGTPVVVVFQYVDAFFEIRDPAKVELFECERADARSALQPVLDDLEDRERRWGIRISVSATNFDSNEEGEKAQVQADLIIDVPEVDGKPSRSNQRWTFDLRDEDGWRVCSAERKS